MESQGRMVGIMVDRKRVMEVPESSLNESNCEVSRTLKRRGYGW